MDVQQKAYRVQSGMSVSLPARNCTVYSMSFASALGESGVDRIDHASAAQLRIRTSVASVRKDCSQVLVERTVFTGRRKMTPALRKKQSPSQLMTESCHSASGNSCKLLFCDSASELRYILDDVCISHRQLPRPENPHGEETEDSRMKSPCCSFESESALCEDTFLVGELEDLDDVEIVIRPEREPPSM